MEFEIKGVKYCTVKLDVFQQLKVSRKLLPVLAGLVSDSSTLKSMMVRDSEGKLAFGEKRAFDVLDIVLSKIADTPAALSEEDANAVTHPCLGVVMCQHEKGWVKTLDQGALMFDDVDLFTMLQLVVRAVADNLGNSLKEPLGSGMFTQP